MVENEDIESIESEELWERWRCEVDKGQGKERIDKYLAEHMTNTSRNRIQTAADAGNVWVNGTPVASNYRVKPGDVIQVLLDHEPHDFTITPENIPLTIVYEDDDLMVINKPAGLVVHPGHGNYEHTLLNALAYYFGEKLDKGHLRSASHSQDTGSQSPSRQAILQSYDRTNLQRTRMGHVPRRQRYHRRGAGP